MNKSILCLGFVFAAVVLVAEGSLFHKDKMPDLDGLYKSDDTLGNTKGLPINGPGRYNPCWKSEDEKECTKCCASYGFTIGHYPAKLPERAFSSGPQAGDTECTCYNDTIV